MPAPRRICFSVADKIIRIFAKLRRDKPADFQRDGFTRTEQPPWVSKGTELKSKAQTIAGMPSGLDVLNIVICQRVVPQDRGLISRQIEKCRTLTLG